MPDKRREALLKRVGLELGRELTTQTHILHALLASRLGLNSTDARCLELISRAGPASLTAGDLTQATGLTTGAITGILDRLEKAGFVERVRDASDRRKVFIRGREKMAAQANGLYEHLGEAMLALARTYSSKELEIIDDYLEKSLAILNEEIARLS